MNPGSENREHGDSGTLGNDEPEKCIMGVRRRIPLNRAFYEAHSKLTQDDREDFNRLTVYSTGMLL